MVNCKKIALILTLFVVCPHILLAANHFIRAGAAGSGSGADWTNACPNFSGACAPASLIRGDTYYVAGGTYTAAKFTVPVSGTAVITIKGATAADHGTSTGWLPTFGVDVSQATFKFSSYGSYPGNAAIYISSSYWVFDGNTGTDGVPSSYGFRSAPASAPCGSDMAGIFYGDGGNVSNVTVRWFAFDASGCSDTDFVGRQGTNEATSGNFNNNTISHFYCNKAQDCVTLHWSNGQVAATGNVIEYMWVPVGGAWEGDTSHHGEQFNLFCQDGLTVRYSTVLSGASTGLLVANDAGAACDSSVGLRNGKIYGNVFGGNTGGNGVITSTGASSITNTAVYNNTFVNNKTGPWFGGSIATGNVAENNIIWNGSCALNTPTHSNNSYLSCTDAAPSESTGRQVISLNPFVSSAAGDYHLTLGAVSSCSITSATCSGDSSIGTAYAIDGDGMTRGADGTWDRGAFEFFSGTRPITPVGLSAVVR